MELFTVAGADAVAWIREHGRFQRTLNAWQLRKVLKRPDRHCTWCGRPVPKGRKTWCSVECVHALEHRTGGANQRWHVHARDKGVCASCGVDTDRLRRIIQQIRSDCYRAYDRNESEKRQRWYRSLEFYKRWAKSEGFDDSFWQADHIVPVCEGGGLCGLEGLRTLCTRCHKRETKSLAARRAAARRKWAQQEPTANNA